MQLDIAVQHTAKGGPQSDLQPPSAQDAWQALSRLPTAAPSKPPSLLTVELPEGESIDCYELARRIADVVETPCCKVELMGPTRRATASGGVPELKARLASYRGAPYSPDWDPDMQISSALQSRRLTELAGRISDFGLCVRRGVLVIFTRGHRATKSVGPSAYMTRSSAKHYLLSCGFKVADVVTQDQAHSNESPHGEIGSTASGPVNSDLVRGQSPAPAQQQRSKSSKPKPSAKPDLLPSPHDEMNIQLPQGSRRERQGLLITSMGKRVLRAKEAITRTGLGRTSFFNRVNPAHPDFDPNFPKRVELGRRAVGFQESEIDEWIAKQNKR